MALRNINYFGEATNRTQVRENVIWMLNEAFLSAGGYYNISSGTLGYDDEDLSELTPSYQPEHSNFQFWKGMSHKWGWESGLNPTYTGGVDPIAVSGIYVSGLFYPSGDGGQYDHYVDYNRGGVVFTNPMPSGLNVFCNRSERAAFIYPSESNEFRRILTEQLRVFDEVPGSGMDTLSPELSSYMPSIFVKIEHNKTSPYELGSASKFIDFKIIMDVFSEDLQQLDFLRDACLSLEGQPMKTFNVNEVSSNNKFPLDYKGRLRGEAQTRSQLLSSYSWKTGKFLENAQEVKMPDILPVMRSRVIIDFQIIG